MTFAELRILFGCILAAGGCGTAMALGDEPERRAALLMAATWVGTVLAQLATGRFYEAAMIGHFVFGAGLLWLLALYRTPWLWFMAVVAAGLLFMHAVLYLPSTSVGRVHTMASDLIAWSAPLLLAGVALHNRSRRRPAGFAIRPRRTRTETVL